MFSIKLLLSISIICISMSCGFQSQQKAQQVITEDPCDGKDSKMHPDQAREAITLYSEYLNNRNGIQVNNADVEFFILADCQMSQITKEFGHNPEVKGHLAIIDKSINLVFEVTSREKNSVSAYFDFNTPCPPLCQ